MTKTILLTLTFLACTAWMVAQQGTPPSSGGYPGNSGSSAGQSNGQAGAPTTGQTGSESGETSGSSGQMNKKGHTTLRGCLSSSGGGYTLTDASGTQYQLSGDTSKLSQHVNNEVEVKGSAEAGSSAGSQTATGSTGEASGQMFNVTKVKKVSSTCNAGGNTKGGMNH